LSIGTIFISYRRQDSGPAARRLAETLCIRFGSDAVFIDTDSIRAGQKWQARITDNLKRTTVLLPVIGPQWLHIDDEYGRRRIDLDEDWVRNEITYCVDHGIFLMPILVLGGVLPKVEALPEPLRALASSQAYEIKDEYWGRDSRFMHVN
jgi:hypothetical protein